MQRGWLLLLTLVARALAGPLYDTTDISCAKSCPEDAKFPYTTGKTYTYDYNSEVTTKLPGSADQSALYVTATAHLEATSPCELTLRLTDVTLRMLDSAGARQVAPRSQEFAASLERLPARFGLADGQIDAVCTADEEETWALNVKRSIMSGFQNTMPKYDRPHTAHEADVVGECDVSYTPASSTWSGYSITKTRDLLACTSRMNAHSILQMTPYSSASKMQSLPLLRSTHTCTQTMLTAGIMDTITCEENHAYRPFTHTQDGGAATYVKFTLTKTGEHDGVSALTAIARRSDLLFEHVDLEEAQLSRREVLAIMQEACDNVNQGVTTKAPQIFMNLVKSLRKLDYNDLKSIASRAPCDAAGAMYRDAIPSLATPAAVAIIRDLVQQDALSEREQTLWMGSLAFISEVSTQMLREVTPLLDSHMTRPLALAVSSMVNTHCRKMDCSNCQEVKDIVSKFAVKLGQDCEADHADVIMVLKAIGNAGNAGDHANQINKCFEDASKPAEVRVAAIQAYRHMACLAESSALESLLADMDVDSELRIEAYISLMQCPTDKLLRRVQHILEKEKVNQVGSFIWTHLTNLMETECPMKQEVRLLLENRSLKATFDVDKRKFSRNIEWSAFSETANVGAAVDSNLIWSSRSFLPRSAMMNLTVDMFGQSVNLLEVGGRVEGMESLLEQMFGDNAEQEEKEVIVPELLKNIDNKYRLKDENEPKGSYYLRIFGNEISYEDLHGLETLRASERLGYMQWLMDLARGQEWDVTRSIMLLDTDLSLPTTAGFPLVMSVDGSAVLDLKIKGKMDMRSLWNSAAANMDINGIVRPSAAVTINAKMGVAAGFFARAGVSLVSTMHSSTEANGLIQLKNGRIFHMDVNMPQEQMDILSVESKFLLSLAGGDEEREAVMAPAERVEYSGCAHALERPLGLVLCGEVSSPLWPVSPAPARAAITLRKTDTFTKYHLEAKSIMTQLGRGHFRYAADFNFNMPGSSTDHEITTTFELNTATMGISARLHSPWKCLAAHALLSNEPELKKVLANAVIDNSIEYNIVAEIKEDKSKSEYYPLVEISMPTITPIRLGGTVMYKHKHKASVALKLEGLTDEALSISGDAVRNAGQGMVHYQSDLSLCAPGFKGTLTGYHEITPSDQAFNADSKLELKYKMSGSHHKEMTLTRKVAFERGESSSQATVSGSFSSNFAPEYDSDFTAHGLRSRMLRSVMLDAGLTYDRPRRIAISAMLQMDSPRKGNTQLKFNLPHHDLNYEINAAHSHSPHHLKMSGSLRSGDQEGRFGINLNRDTTKYTAEAYINTPADSLIYSHSLHEMDPKEYKHDLVLSVNNEEMINIKGTYKMTPRHEVIANIKVPNLGLVHVDTFFATKPGSFDGSAALEYEGERYVTDTKLVFKKKYTALKTSADIEVSYPARSLKLSAGANKVGEKVDTRLDFFWDASHDTSKMFAHNGQLILTKATPSFNVKNDWYGNKKFHLAGSFKNDQQVWWHHTRDLEAQVSLQTSYPGYERMDLIMKHETTPEQWTSHSTASWEDERIVLDFILNKGDFWKNSYADLTLKTPFAFKDVKLTMLNKVAEDSVERELYLMWDNKKSTVKLERQGSLVNGAMETSITLTCPYTDDFRLTGRYNLRGSTHKGSVEVSAYNKVAILTATVERPHTHDVRTAVTLTTPFEAARFLKAETHNTIQGGQLNHETRLTWNNENAILKANSEGSHNRNTLNAALTSSFTRDIVFSGGYKKSGGQHEVDIMAQVAGDTYYLKSNVEKVNELKEFNAQIEMATPFFIAPITLATQHLMAPGVFSHVTSLTKGTDTWSIKADSEGSIRQQNVRGKLSIESTAINDPYLTVSGSYIKEGAQYEALFKANSLGKEGSLLLNVENPQQWQKFKATLEIETPFEMRSIKADTRNTVEDESMSHETTLRLNNHPFVLKATSEGCIFKQNARSKIAISTPYTEDMTLEGSYLKSGNVYEATLAAAAFNEKSTLKMNVEKMYGWKESEASIEVTTPFQLKYIKAETRNRFSDERMEHDFALTLDNEKFSIRATSNGCIVKQNVEGRVVISTPYMDDMTLEGKYIKSGNVYDADLSVGAFRDISQINIHMEKINGWKNSLAMIEISVPNQIDMKFELSNKLEDGNVEHESSLVWNGDKFTIKGMTEGSFINHNARSKLTITCPYTKDMELESTYLNSGNVYEADISLKYHGLTNGKITVEKKNGWKDSLATFEINTPFDLRYIKASMKNKIQPEKFSHKSVIAWNDDKIVVKATSEGSLRTNSVESQVTIKTPFTKDMKAAFSYSKSADKKYTIALTGEVMVWEGSVSASLHSPNGWGNTEATFEYNGPYAFNIRQIKFATQNTRMDKTFTHKTALSMNDDTLTITASKEGCFRDQDVEGKVSIVSTITDDINLHGKYLNSGNKYETVLEASAFGEASSLNANSQRHGGYSGEASIEIKTPFSLKHFKTDITNVMSVSGIEHATTVVMNEKTATVDFFGTISTTSIQGDVKVKWPRNCSFSLSGFIKKIGQKYEADFKANVNNKIASLTFNMDHDLRSKGFVNNGRIHLVYPNIATKTLTWDHNNSETAINSHIEYTDGTEKSVFDIVASSGQRVQLASYVDSPYMNNYKINFDHNIEAWNKITTTGEIQMGSTRYFVQNKFDTEIGRYFKWNTKVSSPEMYDVELNLDSEITSNAISTLNELKWDYNQRLALHGSLSYSKNSMEGVAEIDTPLTAAIIMRTSASWAPNTIKFNTVAVYGRELISRFGIEGNVDVTKKFEMSFASDILDLSNVVFAFEHTGNLKVFEHKASFELNNNGQYVFDMSANMKNTRDSHLAISITTPAYEKYSLKVDHNCLRNTETTVSLELPSYKGSIEHTMAYVNLKDFSSRLNIEYFDGNIIETALTLNASDGLDIVASIKAPFMTQKKIHYTHNVGKSSFASDIKITVAPYESVEAKFVLDTSSARKVVLKIDTPYRNFEILQISITNEGDAADMRNEFNCNFNGNRMYVQTELKLTEHQIYASGKYELPSYNLKKQGELSAEFTGSISNFKNKFKLAIHDESYSGSSEFTLTRKGVQLTAELQTPFELIRTGSLTFKHKGVLNGFSSKFDARINMDRYRGSLQFEQSGYNIKANGKIALPEEYDFSVNHEINNEICKLEVSGNLNGQVYDLENTISFIEWTAEGKIVCPSDTHGYYISYGNPIALIKVYKNDQAVVLKSVMKSFTPTRIDLALSANMPVNGFEDIAIEVHHEGAMKKFNNELVLLLNDDKYCVSSAFAAASLKEAEFSASYSVPYASPVTLGGNYQMDGNISGMQGHGNLFVNDENIILSFGHAMAANNIESSLTMETPFDGFRNIGYSVLLKGGVHNFAAMIQGNVEDNRVVIKPILKVMSKDNFDIALIVRTPVEDFRKTVFSIERQTSWQGCSNEIKLDLAGKVWTISTNSMKKGDTIEMSGSLKTPIHGFSFIEFSTEHTGSQIDFKNRLVAKLEDHSITVEQSFKYERDLLKYSVNAQTPFSDYRTISFTLKHSGPVSNFECDLSGEVGDRRINGRLSMNLEQKNNIYGSFSLNTPFTGFRSLSGEYKQQTLQAYSVTHDLVINKEETKFEVHHKFDMKNGSIDHSILIKTPFDKHPEFVYSFTQNWARNSFNNKLELSTGEAKIVGGSDFKYRNENMVFDMELSTPFEQCKNVYVKINHTGNRRVCASQAHLAYNDKSITFKSEFDRDTMHLNAELQAIFEHQISTMKMEFNLEPAKINVELRTPFTYVELVKVQFSADGLNVDSLVQRNHEKLALNMKHEGTGSSFQNEIVVKRNEESIITSQLQYDIQERKITAELKTAFWPLEFVQLDMQCDESTANIVASWMEEKITVKFVYGTGEHGITIKTPFTGFEDIEVDMKHTGNAESFKNNLLIRLNEEAIRTDIQFDLIGRTLIAELKTPFKLIESVRVRSECDKSSANTIVEWYDYKYILNVVYSNYEYGVNIKTQLPGYEVIEINMKHDGNLKRFENNVVMRWNEKSIKSKIMYDLSGRKLVAELDTPFVEVELAKLQLECDGSAAKSMVQLNDKKISGDITYRRHEHGLKIKTPFDGFEEMEVNMKHYVTIENVKAQLIIRKNEDVISGNVDARSQEQQLTAEVKTPCPIISFAQVKINADPSEISGLVQLNDNAVTINMKIDNSDASVEKASIDITTPFNGYEIIHLSTSVSGIIGSKWVYTVLGKLNSEAVSCQVKFDPNAIEGSISLQTPWYGYEGMSLSFVHHGYLKTFGNEIEGSLNEDRMKLTTEFNLKEKSGSLKFDSSFQTAAIIFSHNGSMRKFTNMMKIDIEDVYYLEYSGKFNMYQPEGSFKVTDKENIVSLSFEHNGDVKAFTNQGRVTYNDFTIEVQNKFDMNVPTASLDLRYGDEVIAFSFENKQSHYKMDNTIKARRNDAEINLESSIDMSNKEGSLLMNTPFTGYELVKLNARHNGDHLNFDNEFSGSINNKRISLKSGLNKRGQVANLEIETPFESFRNLKLNGRHMGNINNFENQFHGSLNGREMSMSTSLNQPMKKLHVQILSPFTGLEDVNLYTSHDESTPVRKTKFTASINDKKFEVDFTIDTAQKSIDITFFNPSMTFEKIAFSVRHKGDFKVFQNEIVASVNDKAITVDTFANIPDHEINLKLTTPFKVLKHASLSAKYNGEWKKCEAGVKLEWNDETITAQSSFDADQMTGFLLISTPFDVLKHLDCHYNLVKKINGFEHEASLALNGQKIHATTNVDTEAKQARFDLTTPFAPVRSFTMEMEHTGDLTAFTNRINAKLNDDAINIRSKLNLDNMKFNVKVRTPFHGFERMSLAFDHMARKYKLSNEIIAVWNKDEIVFKTNFNQKSGTGTFEVHTPFAGFEKVTGTMNHDGTKKDFNNVIHFDFNGKVVNTKTIFNFNQKELSITADCKNIAAEDISFTLYVKHDGNLRNFRNEVKIGVNNRLYTSIVSFYTTQQRASIEITTPYRRYEKLSLTVDHQGNLDNFNNQVSASVNERTYSSIVTYSRRNRQLSIEFASPIHGFTSVILQTECQGSLPNLKSSFEMTIEGKTYAVRQHIKSRYEEVEFGIDLNTPQYDMKHMAMEYKHNGPWSDFSQSLTLNNNDVVSSIVNTFNMAESLVGKSEITLPSGQTTLGIEHTGQLSDFRNNAFITVGSTTYSIENEYYLSGSSLKLVSSVKIPEEYKLFVAHNGPLNGFDNELSFKYPEKTLNAHSMFRMVGGKVRGTVTVEPLELVVDFNHDGNMNGFKQDATVSLMGNEIRHTGEVTVYGVEFNGNFALRTPFETMNSVSLQMNHIGPMDNFKNTALLEVNGYRMKGGSSLNVDGDRTIGEISVKTPERYGFKFDHKGFLNDFTNIIEVTVDGQIGTSTTTYKKTDTTLSASMAVRTPIRGMRTFEVDFDHSTKNAIKTTINLKTPIKYLEKYKFEMNHEGRPRNFKTEASLEMPFKHLPKLTLAVAHRAWRNNFESSGVVEVNEKKYSGVVTYADTRDGTMASVSYETPLSTGSLEATFDGTPSYFSTAFHAQINDQVLSGSLRYSEGRDLQVAVDLAMPFIAKKSLVINYESTARNFNTFVSLESGNGHFEGDLSYKHEDGIMDLAGSLKMPFLNKDIGFDVNHSSLGDSFRTVATLRTPFEAPRSYALEIDHNGPLSNFRNTIKLTTPTMLTPILLDLSHQGSLNDFKTGIALDYGKRIEGELKFKGQHGWYEHAYDTTLKLNTPEIIRNGEFSLQHSLKDRAMKGNVRAIIDGVEHMDFDYDFGSEAKVNLRSPRSGNAAVSFTKADSEMFGEAQLVIDSSPVNFKFGMKNENLAKHVSVQAVLPMIRTVKFETGYSLSKDRASTKTEVQWGNSDDEKILFEAEIGQELLNNDLGRRQSIYDAKVILQSPIHNFETSMKHKIVPHKRHVTQFNLQRFSFQHEVYLKHRDVNGFKIITKVSHPKFTKDVVFGFDYSSEKSRLGVQGRVNLQFADETLSLSTRIADESSGDEIKYVASTHAIHPNSYLDAKFDAEYVNTKERVIGLVNTSYMMCKDQQVKTASLRTEFNQLKHEISIMLDTPVKKISVLGRKTYSDESRVQYSFFSETDGRTCTAQLQLNKAEPAFDFEVNYHPVKKVHVSGKYGNPADIQFHAYHESDGARTQDGEVSLKMNKDNVFNARAYIRPQVFSDIQEMLEMDEETERAWAEVRRAWEEESRLKAEYLRRSFEPLIEAVGVINDYYVTLYDENDYYVQDITDAMIGTYAYLKEKVTSTYDKYRPLYIEHFTRKNAELHSLAEGFSVGAQRYLHQLRGIKTHGERYYQQTKDAYVQYTNTKLWDIVQAIKDDPRVLHTLRIVRAFRLADYIDTEKYMKMAEPVSRYLTYITNRREYAAVVNYFNKAVNNAQKLYGELDIETLINEFVNYLQSNTIETIREGIQEWLSNKLNFSQMQWSSSDGHYQLHLQMPNFDTLPSVDLSLLREHWTRVAQLFRKYMPTYHPPAITDWTMQDCYYYYKPSSDYKDWIPPFKTHASIAGNQHYMTFDKKFYEFAGDCSYVLARDFVDGKFSVIVNYQDEVRTSLTVYSGATRIDIYPDFAVKLEGYQVELPVLLDDTTIIRRGDEIRIDNVHGVTVTCDLIHDHCSVNLSGWYHGKTAGLLGTYDHEQHNDLTTTEHRIVTDLGKFAQSWGVGRCQHKNKARTVEMEPTSREYRICAEFFRNSSSPLRKCNKVVHTEPFMQMCVNDMAASGEIKSACNIASFYRKECEFAGVPVSLPTPCSDCLLEHQYIADGAEKVLGAPLQAADVVFIISRQECNRELVAHMGSIVSQIEKNMRRTGLQGNRYGLVMYGGEGKLNAAHRFTFNNGRFFAEKADFHVEFAEDAPLNGAEDAMAAVLAAAEYTFHAGASKTLILLPCAACEETSVSYAHLRSELTRRDIRFSLLQQEHLGQLDTTEDSQQTAYVFGVDQQGAYTPRTAEDVSMSGDAELRHLLRAPRDHCAFLAQESHGAVFNSLQLTESRTYVQKRFLDVLGRLVAKKATPAPCQICECRNSVTLCRSCEQPTDQDWTPVEAAVAPVRKPGRLMRRKLHRQH